MSGTRRKPGVLGPQVDPPCGGRLAAATPGGSHRTSFTCGFRGPSDAGAPATEARRMRGSAGLVARERSSRAADHCRAELAGSSPPRPHDDCWVQHSVTEKFVLLPVAPRRVRRPSDNLSVDDDLLRQELFSRQIKLGAVGKPIPVVVSDLGPIDVYLPEYQVATEQVLNHQCRHPTLVTGRVLGPPILAGVRVTGVRPPRGAEPRPQLLRSQHPMRLTQASDIR